MLLFNGGSRIIDLFGAGQTYSEIAADVRVDIKTVKNTVTRCINTGERYVWDQNNTIHRIFQFCKTKHVKFNKSVYSHQRMSLPAESTINRFLRERLGFVVFIAFLLFYCIDILINIHIGFCNSYRVTERVSEIDAMLMKFKTSFRTGSGKVLVF